MALKIDLLLIGIFLSLTACAGIGKPSLISSDNENFYLPPTAPAGGQKSATPANQSPDTQHISSLPANCSNNLRFIADVNFPDGSSVAVGSRLNKEWKVENSGTCNWDEGYRIKLIAGPELATPTELALYPARSGTQTVIQILFTAPKEPGTYRSAWQAFSPSKEPFGDNFYIDFVVSP